MIRLVEAGGVGWFCGVAGSVAGRASGGRGRRRVSCCAGWSGFRWRLVPGAGKSADVAGDGSGVLGGLCRFADVAAVVAARGGWRAGS